MPYLPNRPSSNDTSNDTRDVRALDEFIKELESTSEQVQELLETVRGSEIDFAAFKIELRVLCEQVKDISRILRDNDGKPSLVTRFMLLEQKYLDLEKNFEKAIDKKDEQVRLTHQSITDITVAEKTGKWHMRTAVITGVLGLIAGIVALIVKTIH